MSAAARDPLAELARLLPTALDESALHELAARLQPLLPAGQPPDNGKRLYTAMEAAELVGVNIETVRRAIRSGQARGRWPHRPFAADQSRRDRQVAYQHDRDDR